jgi:hypothetical protein
MMAAPALKVGVLLAVVNGPGSARTKLELIRELAEASVRDPRTIPAPLWNPGLRWIGIEWQTFRCERLKVTMPIRDCLETRGAKWPSGRRKGCPKRRECQGCPVGDKNAQAIPGYAVRPPWQPAEVLSPSQRMAKRARDLASIGYEEPVDVLREAAALTPDDDNDWRA